jgi:hypothetical protein
LISISAASPRAISTVLCWFAMEGVGLTEMVQIIRAHGEKFLPLFCPVPSCRPRPSHPRPAASWRRLRWRPGSPSRAPRPSPLDDNPRALTRALAHARLTSRKLHAAANFRARAGKKTSSAVLNIYRAQIYLNLA